MELDEKELIGDNKEMAEAVNHVGDGLQNAVKETLKSERLKAVHTNVSTILKLLSLPLLTMWIF